MQDQGGLSFVERPAFYIAKKITNVVCENGRKCRALDLLQKTEYDNI